MKIKMTNCNKIIFILLVISFVLLICVCDSNLLIERFVNVEDCNGDDFIVVNIETPQYKIEKAEGCVEAFGAVSKSSRCTGSEKTENAADCSVVYY